MVDIKNFQELQNLFKNLLPELQDAIPRILDILKQIIDFLNSPEGKALIQVIEAIIKIIIGLLGASAVLPEDSQIYYGLVRLVQSVFLFENIIKFSEMNIGYLEDVTSNTETSSATLDMKEVLELVGIFLFAGFSNTFMAEDKYLKVISLIVTLLLASTKLWESKTKKTLGYLPSRELSIMTNEQRFNAFINKHKETELSIVFNALVVSVNQSLLTYMIVDNTLALF